MYGLGDSTDTTGAPCPGSPGCPGYVAPGSADYQTSLLQEILANQQAGSPVIQSAPASTGGWSAWLNANSTVVTVSAVVLLGAVFIAKAGR